MRVAILGGGMAGLAAAWTLTEPGGPPVEVTVYQRGWRLGGKGASSRGVHGRIEEHGLHVWLGYYDNAFRLMRAVYEELDRPRTDPHAPILGWRDAFVPASLVGLGEDSASGWSDWLAWFPENDRLPGEPGEGDVDVDAAVLARQLLALLARFGESLDPTVIGARPRAVLSVSPQPPRDQPGALVSQIMTAVRAVAAGGPALGRAATFVELVTTMLRGIVVDGLLVRGFGAIDHLDLRDWLRSHGASEAVLDSPVVRGSYDLAFAYEGGDLSRPRIAAGTGLVLTGRMFLAYHGAMFWKMQAGMGDVVFAPLYEALRRRGVQFELLHRLDGLHLDPDGRRIEAVSVARQVALQPGRAAYEPLVRVRGMSVFSDRLDLEQVDADAHVAGEPLEDHRCSWPVVEVRRLEAGRDFDHVVLAVSVGMVPHVAEELLARSPRWKAMVANVGTVATQAMQVWLQPDERALGWEAPAVTMTGCGAPFDTYASMSHTIQHESWPPDASPQTAASFCAVLEDSALGDPDKVVLEGAVQFLDERGAHLWPRATLPEGGFAWSLLCGTDGAMSASEAVAAQHLRANVDPSDRYVQSLPGSGAHRLRADESGFDNLSLAGDWIETGLNAGCIEAAALSGVQAANAVLGRPLHASTTGFRPRERRDA